MRNASACALITGFGCVALGIAACLDKAWVPGLVLVPVAAFLLMVHWRWSLYVLLGYLTVAGLVSALLYPWDGARLIPHALAAVVYAGFLGEHLLRRKDPAFRSPALVAIGVVSALWLVQAVNPDQIGQSVAGLGLITYVYFSPMILVGYRILSDPVEVRRLATFMSATALPVAAVGIWQFASGPTAYAALGPGFQPWGVGSGGISVFRFPATFSFATQLVEYLLFEILISAGAVAALRGRAQWLGGVALASSVFLIFISGSRTVYLVAPVTLVCLALLLWQARAGSPGGAHLRNPLIGAQVSLSARRSLGVPLPALVLTVAAVGSVAALETDFHVVAARFSSLDPSAEENVPDLTIRVTKTYDQIGSLLDTEPSWWVGHGTGTASPYLWHLGVSRTVEEAFFSEVLYQLGVLGPIAYLAMFGTILAEGIRSLRASPEVSEAVWKRVFFVYVAQVIAMTLLTGDEGLVYFPSNVFFWLFLGGLLAQPAPHREPALANI